MRSMLNVPSRVGTPDWDLIGILCLYEGPDRRYRQCKSAFGPATTSPLGLKNH